MIRNKSIGICILLTLLTCGLYGIFWFYSISQNAGELGNDPSFSGGKCILLSIITCGIYGLYWHYKCGQLMADAFASRGMRYSDNSALYLILSIFGLSLIAMCLIQSDINKLALS